ncbi:MAG: GNAT family N-acetyltransferase [Phycisphaera sp.]|nr:MAG: GNAT family N-acetyltransferase [Phycisphaera sp.]
MAHASLARRFSSPDPDTITIEAGVPADLAPLARFHYAAGRPGPIARVLRAVDDNEVVGVLVASMPTLNGRWRPIAWPGEYDTPDKRANALRLNHDVRVISRVIVDPRYRGRGLAVRLVRAYLDNPQTARTEALATMAHACPFFERAGMRRIELPPSKADARLLRALDRHGLEPADLLHHPPDSIAPSLRAWASARKLRGGDLPGRAFAALTHPPVALVHDRGAS